MKTIESLPSIPPGANPFDHDCFHMGQAAGKGLTMMMPNHTSEECEYLIFVDAKTGKRAKINIAQMFDTLPPAPERKPLL